MSATNLVDIRTIRLLAVEAGGLDPRTVAAVLAGRGSHLARRAVAEAIKRLGMSVAIPELVSAVRADAPGAIASRGRAT